MRIKEFSITRYGPLHNIGPFFLRGFNLFWGKNEEGKTLTIDALVKLLLGRNIRDFERIDRVEENPEGYVIVEDEKGEEIKLPERGNLREIADLSPSECRNIFVVRNSDLSILRESQFYTNVTDQLTGLRTEEISKLKVILRNMGKITPTGMLRDIKGEKLRRRVEGAEDLIGRIEALAEETRSEGFDELEEELVRHREEIDKIAQRTEGLENARKRETYEKGNEALDKLKEASEELKDLEIYSEDDEKKWRDCERDVQAYGQEKEGLLAELRGNEKQLKKTSRDLRKKEQESRVFDERRKELDEEVRPELKNYEAKSRGLTLQGWKTKLLPSVGGIFAALALVSLLGVMRTGAWPFWVVFASFFILSVVAIILWWQFEREKDSLAAVFGGIKWALSRVELSADSIEGILANIQQFDEEYSKSSKELEEARGSKKVLESRAKELGERIEELDRKIRDRKETIDALKRESREESLQNYTKKLKLKQKREKSLGQRMSSLESLFGAKGETLEEHISYWNEEIRDFEEYGDKAKGIEYDEKTVSELKEQEKSCKEKLKELEDKINHFRNRLGEVEREANGLLQSEADYLHCKTSVDLGAVRDKLREFINENESNKDTVLRVMRIFEEMESEEKEKVSELFGRDSSASKHFKGITDGLYEEVLFDQETGAIQVRRSDRSVLEAGKLSGGAYDQLYLSIRLALGEKLLKGEKGFFIMDDPFVKADPDRLQRQIGMLRKISESGWQVIYFSAKGEVRNALQEDIDKGVINHVEMQSTFS